MYIYVYLLINCTVKTVNGGKKKRSPVGEKGYLRSQTERCKVICLYRYNNNKKEEGIREIIYIHALLIWAHKPVSLYITSSRMHPWAN